LEDTEKEAFAIEIITAANARGIPLCLLGGLGVRIACKDTIKKIPQLCRPIHDIDYASYKCHRRELSEIIEGRGLKPRKELNVLYAASRQIFDLPGTDTELAVDVIFDELRMNHTIPLKRRLSINRLTLLPEDLLLTKLQIVELTEKDTYDTIALLLNDAVQMQLNVSSRGIVEDTYVSNLCANDWGLWRTVTGNLRRLRKGIIIEIELDEEYRTLVAGRITEIENSIQRQPKTWRWKIRSVTGERVPWYEVPEEVEPY
jgi:hypothetical protein